MDVSAGGMQNFSVDNFFINVSYGKGEAPKMVESERTGFERQRSTEVGEPGGSVGEASTSLGSGTHEKITHAAVPHETPLRVQKQ
jgi:hypothetical protein